MCIHLTSTWVENLTERQFQLLLNFITILFSLIPIYITFRLLKKQTRTNFIKEFWEKFILNIERCRNRTDNYRYLLSDLKFNLEQISKINNTSLTEDIDTVGTAHNKLALSFFELQDTLDIYENVSSVLKSDVWKLFLEINITMFELFHELKDNITNKNPKSKLKSEAIIQKTLKLISINIKQCRKVDNLLSDLKVKLNKSTIKKII